MPASLFYELNKDTFSATFSKKGGQLISYKYKGHEELLYLSEYALIDGDKAIRGGIPICWPWFAAGAEGAPFHGFVRNNNWTFKENEAEDSYVITAEINPESTFWNYKSKLKAVYTFYKNEPKINISLQSINLDNKAFEVTQAMHTYFNIGNVNKVFIDGLQEVEYSNKLDGKSYVQEGKLKFIEETDRIYYTEGDIKIVDNQLNRIITISKLNSKTSVVWNPWIEKEKSMADMKKEDYLNMCCIETANVEKDTIKISPGEMFSLGTEIMIEKI